MRKYDGGGDSGARDNNGGDGARSTPTVNDGKVYVIDAQLTRLLLRREGREESLDARRA